MSRVKRGVPAHKRRNRVLDRAKGYFGARSKLSTVAREAVEKADLYAYKGRKQRKRQFRMLKLGLRQLDPVCHVRVWVRACLRVLVACERTYVWYVRVYLRANVRL